MLDISGSIPKILRPGFVTYEELKELLGCVDSAETPISAESKNAGNIETAEIENTKADKTENAENSKTNKNTEETGTPKSPGMKYRHYAPKTPLTAVIGFPEQTAKYIVSKIGEDVAALMFDEYAIDHPNIISFGHSKDYTAQASRLFDALRKADEENASAIYAQVPPEDGLGLAIANRIKKAAGSSLISII